MGNETTMEEKEKVHVANFSFGFDEVTPNDIEELLDEIEIETEQKEKTNDNNDVNVVWDGDWDKILKEIRNSNLQYIKNLITSNEIGINSQNPINGKTLLIYAVIIGNYNLVKAICNFGADVHVTDNDNMDGLKYALKYGRYKITELLYYQQLSGKLGNDLKDIATKIHLKNKESENIKKYGKDEYFITSFMILAIQNKLEFGQDMLYYAWYLTLNSRNDSEHPLQSKLFKTMMKTFEKILSNTSDKTGWEWLKKYFINSLIWFLPHPINSKMNDNKDGDEEEDEDDMEGILKTTLFYELLVRVRKESKKQSDKLLKQKINKIKSEKSNEWTQLIAYNVNSKYSKKARQDLCGCVPSEYEENDLSEERYPPSTHFSAKKHYDTNIYLNKLIFKANILDSLFQKDMKLISKQISLESGGAINVKYRAGPIKTLTRSQTKVENDYINEKYPTSAKILDINRCALQFYSIQEMMKYINVFAEKIENKEANSIVDIIRCKNGWSIYNQQYPQYTDIKLNVLVQSADNGTIIAEIQFLLDLMSAFKKKAHKLYSIERKHEIVYNFGTLENKMNKFNDNVGINGVCINLTQNDDIKYFKLLFNTINPNQNTLIDYKTISQNVWHTAIFHIIYKNGEINKYLQNNFKDLYLNTISNYILKYIKIQKDGYEAMLKSISSLNDKQYKETDNSLVKQLFYLIENNRKRRETLIYLLSAREAKASNQNTMIEALCCYGDNAFNKSIKFMLGSNMMNDTEKSILFLAKKARNFSFFFACKDPKYLQNALNILEYAKNDRKLILKLCAQKWSGTTALEFVCKKRCSSSTKIFKLLLKQSALLEEDKINLFVKNANIINYTLHDGYYGNFEMILNYFCPKRDITNRKQIKWIINNVNLCEATVQHILEILSTYFENDKYLFSILSQKNNQLFNKICSNGLYNSAKSNYDNTQLLQFILNGSGLSDKTIINFMSQMNKEYNTLYGVSGNEQRLTNTGRELMNYCKNDRLLLLKLLYSNTMDRQNKPQICFFGICRNPEDVLSILSNKVLTNKDKLKLLQRKDYHGATTLYYMFKRKKQFGVTDKVTVSDILQTLSFGIKFNVNWIIKLLLQLSGKEDRACFLHCKYAKDMERIFDIINDNDVIYNKLLSVYKLKDFNSSSFPTENIRAVIQKYNDYLLFDKSLGNEDYIAIDSTFKEYKTNPFLTTCHFGKIGTIKKLVNVLNGEKLVKLLQIKEKKNPHYSALLKIGCCTYNNGDDRLNAKMLQCILLNNCSISDEIKFKLIATKGTVYKQSLLMIATLHCRLEILRHFKMNKEYFMQLLFDKDSNGTTSFMYICNYNNENNDELQRKILQLIFENNLISDKEKYKLLSLKGGKKTKKNIDSNYAKKNIMTATNKCRLFIINYFNHKSKKKYLFKLLNQTDEENNSALYYMSEANDVKSLENILHSLHLSDQEKIKLFQSNPVHCGGFLLSMLKFMENDKKYLNKLLSQQQSYSALNFACRDPTKSSDILKILNYFINEEKEWIQALSHRTKTKSIKSNSWSKEKNEWTTCLMTAARYQKDGKVLNLILKCIQKMDIDLQSKLLSIKKMSNKKEGGTFISNIKHENDMKTVFSTINNKILNKLWRGNKGRYSRSNYKMDSMLEKCENYLQFHRLLQNNENNDIDIVDLSFNKFSTNPFMTSCYFGKYETINNVLNYVRNDSDKLKLLLLNNYQQQNGNNCLMELAQNGYHQIIIHVLDFLNVNNSKEIKTELLSMKNLYSGQTLLMDLCKNDNNLSVICKIINNISDNKTIRMLFIQKDNQNKTCINYAQQNISNLIQQYL